MTHLGKICDMDTIIIEDGVLKLNPNFSLFVDGVTVVFENGQLQAKSIYEDEWSDQPCVIEKNGKKYKLIVVWGEHGLADGCEWLGLPCAEWYFTGACGTASCTDWDSLYAIRQFYGSVFIGLPALWRYFQENEMHNLEGGQVSAWNATNFQQNQRDSETGLYTPLKYRPEFVLANSGQESAIENSKTEIQNNGDAPYDGTYNPWVESNYYSDPFSAVSELESIGARAVNLVDNTQNRNQLHGYDPITWKSALSLPLNYRREKDPYTIALGLEAFLKGTIGYIRRQINNGALTEKKAAFVNSFLGEGKIELAEPQFTSFLDGAFQFSPFVCRCDRVNGSGHMEIDAVSGITYMEYYAENTVDAFYTSSSDYVDVIISPFCDLMEVGIKDEIVRYASSPEAEAHVNEMNYLADLPFHLPNRAYGFIGNNSMRLICNGILEVEFCYPELGSMPFSCLLWDYFEEVENLQAFMSAFYSSASLPARVELSDIPAGYSRSSVISMLSSGIEYAMQQIHPGDATDSLYTRCINGQDTHAATAYNGQEYHFNSLSLSGNLQDYLSDNTVSSLFS